MSKLVVVPARNDAIPPENFILVELPGTGIQALIQALRATYDDNVLVGRFRAVTPGSSETPKARVDLAEHGTFRTLLSSWAFRTAFPDLGLSAESLSLNPPTFERSWSGTLTLGGELAHTLAFGGAYARYQGSAAEAKTLGEAAVADIAGNRHEDFEVWEARGAWAPWFYDVAWDMSWFVADGANREIVALFVTDTD